MDDTDICRLGTPLEPYKDDEVPSKKPITVADQIAVDSNGRRRFHGAFTGGFSAGYWNTVGSKEGWKPQTFKSSRSEKQSVAEQTPMDYMDEEDTGVFGIAPQYVQTTEDFTQNNNEKGAGQKRKLPSASQGPIPGVPILHLLLDSCHDRVPVSLLKRMGWRESSTRIRKERKPAPPEVPSGDAEPQNDTEEDPVSRVVTCDLGPIKRQVSSDDDDSDDSGEEFDLNFEMDEFEANLVGVKDDRFGIDYVGLDRNALGSSSGQQTKQHFSLFPTFEMVDQNQKKLSIRGQAFGVGAFEEDDDDIYARGDMTQYDFSLGSAPKNVKKAAIKDSGKGALEGFHLVQTSTKSVKEVFRIHIPIGFEPRNWLKRKSRFSPMMAQAAKEKEGKKVGRHDMTPEARGLILGDAKKTFQPAEILPDSIASVPIDEPPIIAVKSEPPPWIPIPEEVIKANETKLAHIPFISDRFVSSNTSETTVKEVKIEPVVVAKEIKVVRTKIIWKPCEMLAYKMNVETIGGAKPDNSAKSFSLFNCLMEGEGGIKKKPLQFTKTRELFTDEASALEKMRQAEQSSKPPPVVKQPQPPPRAAPLVNAPSTSYQNPFAEVPISNVPSAVPARPKPRTELEIDIIKRQNDHPAKKKDIFKAVFDSSSEDEGSDVDLKADQSDKAEAISIIMADVEKGERLAAEKNPAPIVNLSRTAEQLNILRNNSPPRGVFAGLKIPSSAPPKIEEPQAATPKDDDANETDVYGPSLPTIQTPLSVPADLPNKIIFIPKVKSISKPKPKPKADSSDSEQDEWVEKGHKKHKHAKKEKKNKKEQKKHKKEKRKSSRDKKKDK